MLMPSAIAELFEPISAAKPLAARYSCALVQNLADLAALEASWPRVPQALDSPMASFGWTWAGAVALATEQSPQVIVASCDGEPRGVAALAHGRNWGLQRWEMLGVRRINEPADLTYADDAALVALVEAIIGLRRPLLLGRLPADSPTLGLIQRACRGRGVVLVRPQASCPTVALDDHWLQPEGQLSSRRRSDYRRALRRADQEGGTQAEIITPRPDEVDSLLDLALEIEARSWKGAAGTALAQDPQRGRFLREFARWASRAAVLRIALLRIGGAPSAMQVAVEQGERWWLLKIGFDPALGHCSPGNLLLAETLRHAAQRGLKSYEFLGTVEPWTQVWTRAERQCVSVRIYPRGLRGAAALARDAAGAAWRRLKLRRAPADRKSTGGDADTNRTATSEEAV